jgi:hypothetical protein
LPAVALDDGDREFVESSWGLLAENTQFP